MRLRTFVAAKLHGLTVTERNVLLDKPSALPYSYCSKGRDAVPAKKKSTGTDADLNMKATPRFKKRFEELATQWRNETGVFSSITKKIQHAAYQEIIRMGAEMPDAVLSMILAALQDNHDHWFTALRAIAKDPPASIGTQVSAKLAREAWLKWGREKRLI